MGKEILKITYIGKDATFFQKLQDSFREKYPKFDYSFTLLPCEPKEKIQSLICNIAPDSKLIIIDLSLYAAELLQLCRVIKRTNSVKHIMLMGLFDQLVSENTIKESIITGVKINHLKMPDNVDFLYDFFSALMPDEAKELDYVVGELSDEVQAKEFLKGGYITLDKIHAEGDLNLTEGDDISIDSFLTESKILSSPVMKIKKISKDNIFYNFQFSYDLQFKYVDLDETSDSARYVEAVEDAKYRLGKWLSSKKEISSEKKTRIFLIDRALSIYKENIIIDAYPFMIRCQPFLTDAAGELSKINPQIILVGLDSAEVDAQNHSYKNDVAFLSTIVSYIKSREAQKYHPYLVIFNTTEHKDNLQEALGYSKIMTVPGEVTGVALIKMAQMFEAKWQKKLEAASSAPKKQIYLSKDSPLSVLEVNRKIYLKTVSESEITFNADFSPLMYSVFHIQKPFDIFLTVVPAKKDADKDAGAYRGVINGIGEEGKEKLRQFINAIYFRDLEESKKEDKEGLDKLKENYLAKKAEEEKKKADAEAAQAMPDSIDQLAKASDDVTKKGA